MKGLFLGLTTVDIQYLINSFPKENGKQKSENFLINIGGPALNAAASFVKLGGEAIFFTVVGNHALSTYVKEQCDKLNINVVDLCPIFSELPIVASVLSNTQTGDRAIIRNKGITPEPDLGILSRTLSITQNSDIVLVDGFHMSAALTLARYGKKNKIPVVFDGGSWKAGCEDLLEEVDIAICSNDFKTPEVSVMKYLANKGIQSRAITKGELPIQYELGPKKGEVPVPQVEALDTLGAGDVFHGAFCYYFSTGKGFVSSLKSASLVAAESTTKFGLR